MHEMPTGRYRYKNLETDRSIRLVTILPGAFDDEIHLEIQHRHLDADSPSYEALSYVWGISDSRGEVFINNISFDVTPNLFRALRHLRYSEKSRITWIDAIAINQDDLNERAIQVPLMRYIYPRAAATIVYVGEADTDTAWAFNCFEMLHALYSFWYETPKAATQRGLRARVLQYDLPRLFRFLRREWFERAWTFQEICLSTEVQIVCGEYSIAWSVIVFAIAAVRMGSDGAGLVGVQDRALTRIEYWALLHLIGKPDAPRQFSMTTLLYETRGLATTNPVDRIYSLMAVANIGRVELKPDYTLSVAATYILATRWSIINDNDLRVFQQLDRPKRVNDLPSWVPDWRQKQRGLPLIPSRIPSWLPDKSNSGKKTRSSLATVGKFYDFNAPHSVGFTDRPLSDKPSLSLVGTPVDVIEAVHLTRDLLIGLRRLNKDTTTSWRQVFSEIKHFVDALEIPGQSSDSADCGYMELLRTLCADHLPISRQRQLSAAMIPEQIGHYKRNTGTALFRSKTFAFDAEWVKQMYMAMWSEAAQQPATPSTMSSILGRTTHMTKMVVGIRPHEDEETKRSRIAREYCSAVCGALDGRALILTHDGRIGLGPDRCAAGDQVFSLLGGDVPYVLRPTARVPEYIILGEAYLHGVMDGELWDSADGGGSSRERCGVDREFEDVVLV